jgi:hypothetical protein
VVLLLVVGLGWSRNEEEGLLEWGAGGERLAVLRGALLLSSGRWRAVGQRSGSLRDECSGWRCRRALDSEMDGNCNLHAMHDQMHHLIATAMGGHHSTAPATKEVGMLGITTLPHSLLPTAQAARRTQHAARLADC